MAGEGNQTIQARDLWSNLIIKEETKPYRYFLLVKPNSKLQVKLNLSDQTEIIQINGESLLNVPPEKTLDKLKHLENNDTVTLLEWNSLKGEGEQHKAKVIVLTAEKHASITSDGVALNETSVKKAKAPSCNFGFPTWIYNNTYKMDPLRQSQGLWQVVYRDNQPRIVTCKPKEDGEKGCSSMPGEPQLQCHQYSGYRDLEDDADSPFPFFIIFFWQLADDTRQYLTAVSTEEEVPQLKLQQMPSEFDPKNFDSFSDKVYEAVFRVGVTNASDPPHFGTFEYMLRKNYYLCGCHEDEVLQLVKSDPVKVKEAENCSFEMILKVPASKDGKSGSFL